MFELLGITLVQFELFLLVTARVLTIIVLLPIFSSNNINPFWKVFLGLYLALICTSLIRPPEILPVSFSILAIYAMKEIVVGLAIGLAAKVLFEVLHFAGFMVGRGMGLAMLTVVDPATDDEINAIGQLMYFVAILIMFSINGHHFFIRAVFDSFYLIPITEAFFSESLVQSFIIIIGDIFKIGFMIGAPVIVLLFIQKVILAFLSRISPEMNVFFLGLPLGILMGLYILSIYWQYFSYAFIKYFEIFQENFTTFIRILGP